MVARSEFRGDETRRNALGWAFGMGPCLAGMAWAWAKWSTGNGGRRLCGKCQVDSSVETTWSCANAPSLY